MTDDGKDFNPRDGEDYTPLVPNVRKRAPERKGKPRAAQHDEISASLSRIIDDILERDGRNLRAMKYRGRGR